MHELSICYYFTLFIFWISPSRSAYFSQFSSLKEPEKDPCYDATGRPVRCVPDFINAAFGKPVIASSTCGLKTPTKYCTLTESEEGLFKEQCDVCDASDWRQSHPASLLTDLNNSNNNTCWISDPTADASHNVTLTLSLGKKFELTYVSLQFCGRLADSLAIYKSTNGGKTWTPFQYFSSDCQGVYGKSPNREIGRHNEQEAKCTDSHVMSPVSSRIAFPTLEGRPSASDFERSPVLQDWVTATDVRIVFNRLSLDQRALYGITGKQMSNSVEESNELEMLNENDTSISNTADLTTLAAKQRNVYAVAELAVGGRCKCNGHASRCFFDKFGRYSCDCKHNTAGTECEKCKPFHYDRPWARATTDDAHACVACNCNLHARKCRFNQELYRLSGGRSGGICVNCRHNTAGRNCHYCRLNYYRDQSKPITHRKACRPCLCHPIGSLSKNCNQTSGQCICKPGVDGQTCNRCAKGYQQSRSPITPCIRIPTMLDATSLAKSADSTERAECHKCRATPARINQKKFCKRDYVAQVHVVNRELLEGWVKYSIRIGTVFKRRADGTRIRRGMLHNFWLPNSMVLCKCPKLKLGRKYLIMGRDDMNKVGQPGIVFNRYTIMIEWREDLVEQLDRFSRREHHCHNYGVESSSNKYSISAVVHERDPDDFETDVVRSKRMKT
ncbi:laminin EGF domain-containing protein [Ditylenchus destructor]|uniref:Netrin-1 n=1 Tax=Ditylenchus destructor TaxID=166010 RepID=A0AAD4R6H8_9BILA|nr:laminin EGF domain-containing protein [Ditylenchus destructor]